MTQSAEQLATDVVSLNELVDQLDVRIAKLHKVIFTTHFPQQHLVVCFFLTEVVGGELRAGDDAQDARTFPLDALPEEIAFSTHREVIGDLLEGKI